MSQDVSVSPAARTHTLARSVGHWAALAVGLALPLAFAPFGLWFVAILCVGALFWLFAESNARGAARVGFLFGGGAFLTGTYWLYTSIHIFGKAPAALAIFLMLGLVAIMACYFALLGYATRRWLWTRAETVNGLLILPAAWVLTEWLRGWFLSGFPWLSLGYSQIDSPLGAIAPFLGVHGVGWAVVFSAGALYAVVRSRTVAARAVAALLGVSVWLGAFLLGQFDWTQAVGEPLRVSVIQGGITQDRKWLPEQRQPTLELYRSLTAENWDSRLIVWPEAAIPALLHEVELYVVELGAEARRHGSELLIGVLRYDFDAKQYRNAVITLGEAPGSYHKRHLVPFGEYFPVPAVVREWMRLLSLPYVDFAAGGPAQPPLRVAGQPVAVSICYEDAFAAEQLSMLPEASLLVNVSNDAWFGDSTAPHQHLEMARMRAREVGRYLIRATNTGVSALIGPDGRIIARSPQFEASVLTDEIEPRGGTTPYIRYGNWAICLLAVVFLVVGVSLRALSHGKL